LKANEAQALLGAVEDAKREMAALVLAQSVVQRREHEIVIEVPAVAGGREVHLRLRDRFRATLGEERFALHEDVGFATALEQMLNSLGLNAFTLTLTHQEDSRFPGRPYRLSQGQFLPGGGGGRAVGGGLDLDSLRLNLGPLAPFVPEDF
jgi:hypothetical protein